MMDLERLCASAERLRTAVPELIAEVEWLRAELGELEHTFDLRWKADMRAIALWREGHPERELRQPDHADLVLWLLDDRDAIAAKLKAAEERIEQLGYTGLEYPYP